MNKKIVIPVVVSCILVAFIACVFVSNNKKQVDKKVNNKVVNNIEVKQNVIPSVPASAVPVTSKTEEEFKTNFSKCNKSIFYDNAKKISVNVSEDTVINSKCNLSFNFIKDGLMTNTNCSFDKKDLSQGLYDSLIKETGKDFDISKITNKSCKTSSFTIPETVKTEEELRVGFSKCKKVVFYDNVKKISTNISENVADSSKCIISFNFFKDSVMTNANCSFDKKDLSVELYDSLIKETGKDFDISKITNKSCTTSNITIK